MSELSITKNTGELETIHGGTYTLTSSHTELAASDLVFKTLVDSKI